jgi:hypothetical protein
MYETASGEKTDDIEKIKCDVFNFYNNLLGQDIIEEKKIKEYKFNIKSLNVSESLKSELNKKITYDEAIKCIKKMKVSAPGSSDLTIGFLKKFFEFFGLYFVDILNSDS